MAVCALAHTALPLARFVQELPMSAANALSIKAENALLHFPPFAILLN
jgi:hypothetical protein